MIAVGVDTHKERHYAVALDHVGQMLAELVFPATPAGYAELQGWAEQLATGREFVFGVEGAGSWGAGLCEYLLQARHVVLEVERPRRRDRRAGKSDRIDAIAAAKRVLNQLQALNATAPIAARADRSGHRQTARAAGPFVARAGQRHPRRAGHVRRHA